MTVLPGGARILHRLALALEVLDALTSRPVTTPVAVRREGSRRQFLSRDGRVLLLFGPGVGDRADVRITDATRQFAPRRFRVPLWQLADVDVADHVPPGPYVPALSRLLRVWLSPGAAGRLGPGFTAIRGRVARGTEPVRWPRIAARGPGPSIVGRAHGDERGEFLLPVTGTGTLPPPAPSLITVDLLVSARGPAGPPPPSAQEMALDPFADLVLEAVPRSSSPPLPAEIDNPLLRGRSLPPFYVPSTAPVPTVDVAVGDVLLLRNPLQFSP
jgi:hypothetical protein